LPLVVVAYAGKRFTELPIPCIIRRPRSTAVLLRKTQPRKDSHHPLVWFPAPG
jgi:hypothetical protein